MSAELPLEEAIAKAWADPSKAIRLDEHWTEDCASVAAEVVRSHPRVVELREAVEAFDEDGQPWPWDDLSTAVIRAARAFVLDSSPQRTEGE